MKRAVTVLLALAALPLCGRVYPQFGMESFLGGHYHLFSLAPWGGLRVPLGPHSSLIVKFRRQTIAFDYEENEVMRRQISSLSMVTAVYYFQKEELEAYAALFQMFGSGDYRSTGVDVGLAYRLFRGVAAEAGLYLLNEKSTLWYPGQAERRITTGIWHIGLKLALFSKLELNPQVNIGSNSESVSVFAGSASLNYSLSDSICITLTYTRYSENARYRYSGNYFSGGINFYF